MKLTLFIFHQTKKDRDPLQLTILSFLISSKYEAKHTIYHYEMWFEYRGEWWSIGESNP